MRKKIFGLNSHKQLQDHVMQSGLASPTGESIHLNVQNENTFVEAINRKFSNFMKNRKNRQLTEKIKAERGRNNPIKYEQQFNFKQQWQLTDKSNYTLHYNYLFPQKVIFRVLNSVMLFILIFLIWILSIFRLFQYYDNFWIFSYCLAVSLLDLVLKTFFIYYFLSDEKIRNQHKRIQKLDYVQKFIGNLFAILYSVLGMTTLVNDVDNDIYLILDFACILVVYMRCQQIYKNFKMLIICSKYKAYMKISDLMSNLFVLTHLFGVLIYAVSRFQPSHTYLSIIQIRGSLTWFDKYIYSIYFSSTTMLTVGYGDLLPANIQEIVVVLFMQLFGIVMIGYINGEVGDVLCTLRRQKESLQNDLTNSQKLSKSFRLTHQTSQKIRQYLINNRKIDEELNIQDENNLLSKINDELRLQANYTNHINIIKESLLFVYNFSKKTQIQVSYKLNKIVFSPNQTLPQLMGKQKIYLLSKGEIAIFVSKRNKKEKYGRKILRTLNKNSNSDFYENSFGHTALILGRSTQLKAFSKDFAICHTIERHDFLDALAMDSNDLERFHEMRAKYETSKHPQKEECPEFYTIREHYAPNPEFVIKKYLKQNHRTKRRQWIRDRQRCRTVLQLFENDGNDTEDQMHEDSSSQDSASSASSIAGQAITGQEQILNEKERQNKYKNLNLGQLASLNIRARNYSSKYMNKKYQEKREELVSKIKSSQFEEPFETIKEYSFFFKHANISHVLKKCMFSNTILQIVTPFIEILPTFYDQNTSSSKLETKIFRHRRMLKSLPF